MHEDRRNSPVRAVKDHAKIVELVIQNQAALPSLANEICYPILREPGVTTVFGVHKPPGEAWPYVEDSKGAHVVVAISQQLDPGADPQLTNR